LGRPWRSTRCLYAVLCSATPWWVLLQVFAGSLIGSLLVVWARP
jgi:hypothetical protein